MEFSQKYRESFKEVYISYYSRMKRFAQQYVIREEDADNIVQDIFLELWEKQLQLNSIVNLNGFLFRILKNKCIDFLRRKKLEQQIADKIQSEYIRTLMLKFESLEALEDKFFDDVDTDTIIQKAIDSLPEKCREIFIKNKIEGKKQKLIAEELYISVHTVESQMAIAYKKLRKALINYPHFLIIFLF